MRYFNSSLFKLTILCYKKSEISLGDTHSFKEINIQQNTQSFAIYMQ